MTGGCGGTRRSDEEIRADLAIVANYQAMWTQAVADVKARKRRLLPPLYGEEAESRNAARRRLADDVEPLLAVLAVQTTRIENELRLHYVDSIGDCEYCATAWPCPTFVNLSASAVTDNPEER